MQMIIDSGEGREGDGGYFFVRPSKPSASAAGGARTKSNKRKSITAAGKSARNKVKKTTPKNGGTARKVSKEKAPVKEKAGVATSLLSELISLKLARYKEKSQSKKPVGLVSAKVAKKVALAKKFKEMTVALDGNKVMAANSCPESKSS